MFPQVMPISKWYIVRRWWGILSVIIICALVAYVGIISWKYLQQPLNQSLVDDQKVTLASTTTSVINSKIIDGSYYLRSGSEIFLIDASMYYIKNNFAASTANDRKKLVQGADVNTFTPVCVAATSSVVSDFPSYSKDAHSVFYEDRVVVEADAATFRPLLTDGVCNGYAVDAHHVFYEDKIIASNPQQFSLVDGLVNKTYLSSPESDAEIRKTILYTDGNNIFQYGRPISTDASHFRQIHFANAPLLFAEDNAHLYMSSYQSSTISPAIDSDSDSFAFLKNEDGKDALFAKDKKLVYYTGEPECCAPTEFISTDSLHADAVSLVKNAQGGDSACGIKDADKVFVVVLGSFYEIPNADPQSFVVTNTNCTSGKDKNGSYIIGSPNWKVEFTPK